MRCLLLAEGSHDIGAGHQVRSAMLAKTLMENGHQAYLCARDLPGSSHIWAWHGFDQCVEGAVSLAAIYSKARQRWKPNYVVIDHYDGDDDLWTEVKPTPCMVRDDIPRSRFIPRNALVMNSGPQVFPSDYPWHACICGPAWHILPRIFHDIQWVGGNYLVICLGLSDTCSLMEEAIEYVLQEYEIDIRIICSEEQAIRLQDRQQRVKYHYNEDAKGVANLIAQAQCAVLSASSIALEAMAIGVPFAGVQFADNQAILADALKAQKVPVFDAANITEAIDGSLQLKQKPYKTSLCSDKADQYVVDRLCLHQICAQRCDLRFVRWSDACDLWEWANDHLTRQFSFSDVPFIPWQEHCAWLAQALVNPARQFFMYSSDSISRDVDGVKSKGHAFVRLDVSGNEATVGIVVAPSARGEGVAHRALAALIEVHEQLGQLSSILAEIKSENAASLRVFERCGFSFKEHFKQGRHDAQRWVYTFKRGGG